ncbi:MAG: hypothetical protein AABZ44_08335 [Elusimicrobiota bacterium]
MALNLNIKDIRKLDYKVIEAWLYNNDFADGVKDKALQKPLIVLAASILIGAFIAHSSSAKAVALNAQIAEQKQRGEVMAQYQGLAARWSELTRSRMLPAGVNAQEWLQSKVDELSGAAGAQTISFEFTGDVSKADKFSAHSAAFTVKCVYRQLGDMVSRIEHSEPFIGIASLRLARKEDFDFNSGKAIIEAKIVMYVLQQKVPVGGVSH